MKDEKPKRAKPKTRSDGASNALRLLRVSEIVRIRLNGGKFPDLRDFVRLQESLAGSNWHLEPGEQPMSDGNIKRYQNLADKEIRKSCERNHKKLIMEAQAQRENVYALAILSSDLGSAMRALDSKAKLLGLNAAVEVEMTVKGFDGEEEVVTSGHDVSTPD